MNDLYSKNILDKIYSKIKIVNDNKRECPICGDIISKYGIKNHIRLKHTYAGQKECKKIDKFKGFRNWSKGLTKEDNIGVAKMAKTMSKVKKGKLHNFYGENHSKESKIKISKSMKKAHQKGKAGSWLDSRDKNNKSYPEKFFMKVIKNNFNDINYEYEYRFKKFSIDFAWIHKKLAIEIDGSQHKRFEEQKRRDEEKDALLQENGWKIMRIPWKKMYNNPHKFIKKSKNFIDAG